MRFEVEDTHVQPPGVAPGLMVIPGLDHEGKWDGKYYLFDVPMRKRGESDSDLLRRARLVRTDPS